MGFSRWQKRKKRDSICVTFYDGKRPGKQGELKSLHYFSRSHLVREPPLVKVNKIPSSVLIIFFLNRQKCSISGLKSFNLIKWRNNDVIIFWWTLTRGHPWSFVVIRGHSWYSWSLVWPWLINIKKKKLVRAIIVSRGDWLGAVGYVGRTILCFLFTNCDWIN